MTAKRYVVGIDPGVKCGLAVFDSWMEKLVTVETVTFWRAHDEVRARFTPEEAVIVIEQPKLNLPMYARHAGITKSNVREKMAQNIGHNKAYATLLIERFESFGYEVVQVKPSRRKWEQEDLVRQTGWTGKTSEHARDAARLIYDRL